MVSTIPKPSDHLAICVVLEVHSLNGCNEAQYTSLPTVSIRESSSCEEAQACKLVTLTSRPRGLHEPGLKMFLLNAHDNKYGVLGHYGSGGFAMDLRTG